MSSPLLHFVLNLLLANISRDHFGFIVATTLAMFFVQAGFIVMYSHLIFD